MNNRKDYTTSNDKKARKLLIALLILVVVAGTIYLAAINARSAAAEDQLITCWVMCKPGGQVNVRRKPTTDSKSETQLDCGEEILTDGDTEDGWLRVYGVGENGGGWVYVGFVVTEKPECIGQRYVCVAKKQVACRRWIGGPVIDGRAGWLQNGENVEVFLMADGWAVTSRGYVQSEWLEADPE